MSYYTKRVEHSREHAIGLVHCRHEIVLQRVSEVVKRRSLLQFGLPAVHHCLGYQDLHCFQVSFLWENMYCLWETPDSIGAVSYWTREVHSMIFIHTRAQPEGGINEHWGYFPVFLPKPWVNPGTNAVYTTLRNIALCTRNILCQRQQYDSAVAGTRNIPGAEAFILWLPGLQIYISSNTACSICMYVPVRGPQFVWGLWCHHHPDRGLCCQLWPWNQLHPLPLHIKTIPPPR